MNNPAIRLRFAPSPTGFLHVGNLRTALFGYLIAKSQGGKFILRIEDTDQKREVKGAVKKLLEIMAWVGIEFDEGPYQGGEYGPYIQTQRLKIYQEQIEKLLNEGRAYRCFCSAERLEKMRQDQQKHQEAPRYDRHCRDLSPEKIAEHLKNGDRFVIRQKMPLDGEVKVFDELRGEIVFPAQDLEDHVLIKSDGIPTYQFASVVDDHLMAISHVTRGDEWLPSFPKNILLYQACGWTPPKFIHLPLILNKTGGKLSKRQGDVFVEDYRTKGYTPEALINFCVLLGWHPKTEKDNEIYSLAELKKIFSISGMGSSPAVFDLEKLNYYNGHYLRQKNIGELTESCLPYLIKDKIISRGNILQRLFTKSVQDQKTYCNRLGQKKITRSELERIISLSQDRLKTLSEISELSRFLFLSKLDYNPELLIWKNMNREEAKNHLNFFLDILEKIPDTEWTKERMNEEIMERVKREELPAGEYLWPLRIALSGQKNSPGPAEIAWALGREGTLNRIKAAIAK
ncbi:MAG TPA: glutamate--tRNA ligase [bacterium]|nr:glutamate--tRNA ligase [bacterium]HPT29564.1 glutamate--tRNA ligase [bacterium]